MRSKICILAFDRPSLTGGLFPCLLILILLAAPLAVSAYEVRLRTRLERLPLPAPAIAAARTGRDIHLLLQDSEGLGLYRLQDKKLQRIRRGVRQMLSLGKELLVETDEESFRLRDGRIRERIAQRQTDLRDPRMILRQLPLRRGGAILFCNDPGPGGSPYARLFHATDAELRYRRAIDSPLPADGPFFIHGGDDRFYFFARERDEAALHVYHPARRAGRRITELPLCPGDAALSDDGSRLILADRDRGTMRLIELCDGAVQDLELPDGRFPAWSPDGTSFLYLETKGTDSRLLLVQDCRRVHQLSTTAAPLPPIYLDGQRVAWFEDGGACLTILRLPSER